MWVKKQNKQTNKQQQKKIPTTQNQPKALRTLEKSAFRDVRRVPFSRPPVGHTHTTDRNSRHLNKSHWPRGAAFCRETGP